MIDVQDQGLNIVLNICFLGIALLALLSVIPWQIRRRRNRWTLWLPWAALVLYAVYETTMPARMNIRVDIFLIWPLLAVVLGAWLVRRFRMRRAR